MNTTGKLPISAIVVSCNEGHLLERCLKGIYFCDEIILVNLSSNDETVNIGNKYGARILNYQKHATVEELHFYTVPQTKNDWILLTDPDEETDSLLSQRIYEVFVDKKIDDYGAIRVPIQFYFKDKPLKGTTWGGKDANCRYMFKKGHFSFENVIHSGVKMLPESKTYTIQRHHYNLVNHHYWMISWKQLFEKHSRYNMGEGIKLFQKGERYSLLKQLINSLKSVRSSYYIKEGYKDGAIGFFLSLFWGYYTFNNWNKLKHHQNSQSEIDS